MIETKLERRMRELALAAGAVWEAWLETQPADEMAGICAEIEHDGARPGIRFIAGDDRHSPQLTFLVRTRAGDVESVGALELTV